MLKLKYTDPAEIPEQFKELYEERDGEWRLKLDDKVIPKAKLEEFRSTNVELMNKLKEYESRLSDVDVEEYKALKQKMKELEEKKLIDAGKIDELVNKKALEIKQSFEGELQKLQKEREKLEKQSSTYREKLARTIIDSEVQKAVLSIAKPRQGAINDILLRAKTIWKITDDGSPMPLGPDGKVIKTENGPLSFKEWAENLVNEAPYLFEGSGGGGGHGGNGGGGRPKTISRHDKEAFLKNLDAIAKGEIQVTMD